MVELESHLPATDAMGHVCCVPRSTEPLEIFLVPVANVPDVFHGPKLLHSSCFCTTSERKGTVLIIDDTRRSLVSPYNYTPEHTLQATTWRIIVSGSSLRVLNCDSNRDVLDRTLLSKLT
jgi:hypothetical protein